MAHACVAALQAPNAVGDAALQRSKAVALTTRLAGGLLNDDALAEAERVGDRASATTYRLLQLGELLFVQAQGGSAALPGTELEQRVTAHLTTLRTR